MWQVGNKYFIQTVTMYYIGQLGAITENELWLENASWVADAGNLNDFLSNGITPALQIVALTDELIVNRGAVISAVKWRHELPAWQPPFQSNA